MKPVAIFRHTPTEGPGYFATHLEARGRPWELIRIDAGEAVPDDPSPYAGLCFMGGPMSVNDPLPWIAQVEALIRRAADMDIPVIGHCLGGQLMSKALGGAVTNNPVKEIGWGEVRRVDTSGAWAHALPEHFASFHWHGETFSLPPGAARLLDSPYCANQAWTMGKHLAMQCHVEMTPEMIETWSSQWASEAAAPSPSVQSPEAMRQDMPARTAELNAIAGRLYDVWLRGLKD
jgi:GMP synthase-like glutamine amidotransferase